MLPDLEEDPALGAHEGEGEPGRTVHDAEPLAPPDLPEAPEPRTEPAQPARPSEAFFLEVETAEAGTVRHVLAPGEHLVGRGSDADVVVESPTLSRVHARLVVDDDGVRVIDLESTNGTRVAGGEVAPGTAVAVPPGSELELGSVPCRIVRAPLDAPGQGET